MGTQRAHIILPEDLIADLDQAVGPRGRSAFIVETVRDALRRRHMLAFLEESRTNPAWKPENHPELKDGAGPWVRKLRAENNARMERVEQARKHSR